MSLAHETDKAARGDLPRWLPSDRVIILDACCAINLFGSGRMREILTAVPGKFCVEGYVYRHECGQIWLPDHQPEKVAGPVNLEPFIEDGLLRVVDIDDAEAGTAVAFALQRLDDGEARTAAVAVHRRFIMATDDRAARRLLEREHHSLTVIGTPAMIREWASAQGVIGDELREVLETLEFSGNYVPSNRDPDAEWWNRAIGRIV